MTPAAPRPDDFAVLRELFAALRDETISTDQLRQVEKTLQQDARARAYFARLVQLHVLLEHKFADASPHKEYPYPSLVGDDTAAPVAALSPSLPSVFPVLANTLPSTVGWFSSGWPVAYLIATVIFGIGLVIGSVVHVSEPVQVARHSSVPSRMVAEPKIESVGRITGMVDCQWERGSEFGVQSSAGEKQKAEIRNQKSLVVLGDKFALSSGLMEITYDTGAKVILQGPVTYEVESASGGYLSVGKLTGKVEKKAEEPNPQSPIPNPSLSTHHYPLFTIKTPTAVVTDLGTEFGVEVNRSGATETHVYNGRVQVRGVAVSGEAEQPQILHAGQRARCDDRGQVVLEPMLADGDRFVRQIEPAQVVGIEENFFGERVGASFEQNPPQRFVLKAGAAEYQGPPNTRGYIRTVATDFYERDFVFEAKCYAQLNRPSPRDDPNRIYFGISDGVPRGDFCDELAHGIVLVLVFDTTSAFVKTALPEGTQERVLQMVAPPGSICPGTYRLRMAKYGTRVWFTIDMETSDTLHTYFNSSSFALPADAPGLNTTNSHLVVGTGNLGDTTVRFERLSVTYPNRFYSGGLLLTEPRHRDKP